MNNNKKYFNHVLTEAQARRLGVPHLAHKTVSVSAYDRDHRVASEVWYKGTWLGGTLDLDDRGD